MGGGREGGGGETVAGLMCLKCAAWLHSGIMKLAPSHTGKTHKTNLVPRRNKLTFST